MTVDSCVVITYIIQSD